MEIEERKIPEDILDQTVLFKIHNPNTLVNSDRFNFEYSKDNINLARLTVGNLNIRSDEIDVEYY